MVGLGIGGGLLGHGPTFAQVDFSVKVMRHIGEIKPVEKSFNQRIGDRASVSGFWSRDDERNRDFSTIEIRYNLLATIDFR